MWEWDKHHSGGSTGIGIVHVAVVVHWDWTMAWYCTYSLTVTVKVWDNQVAVTGVGQKVVAERPLSLSYWMIMVGDWSVECPIMLDGEH